MQIPNTALNATQTSISFMPPPAAELIQQHQQQLPVVAASTTADGAQSQEFGGAKQDAQPALYTRQGQVASADAQTDNPEKSAVSSSEQTTDEKAAAKPADDVTGAPTKNVAGKELTLEQQEELLHLQQRDQEVRVHEQQHASVGGQHTGSPSYDFKTGPDGKQYVVGGSVSVDLSPIAGDPTATIDKMRQVKAAALAPAQPSSADKNAAAAADTHIANATAELMQAAKAATTDEAEPTTAAEAGTAPTAAAADKAAANEPSVNAKATTNASPSDTATAPQTASNDKAKLEHINQVIAGVYGKSAQAQSQQLLSLA